MSSKMATFVETIWTLIIITNWNVEADKRLILDPGEDLALTVQNLQNTVNQLKADMTLLKSSQQCTKTGSTYVRWGKSVCPGNGSELVYKGFMAGNKWDKTGGGTNHLCLPDHPNWAKYMDGTTSGSVIRGTEIEGNDALLTLLFGSNVYNQDPSCVVCKTTRSTSLMISGRSTCYDSWTLEYQGYVVAAEESSFLSGNEFVCLDANPDLVQHGSGNDEEHVIYVVEAQCGSSGGLPCPPYVQGRELACVVCSQ